MDTASTSSPWSTALRGLVALAVAMGIGRFAFTPQLPLMQAEFGLSLAAGGWLAGANYAGYLCGALLAGRRGASPRGLLRAGLWGVAVSTAAMAADAPTAFWLAARFVAGVASAWVLVGTAALCLTRLAALGRPALGGVVFAGVGAGIAAAGLLCHAAALKEAGAAASWWWLAMLATAGTLFAGRLWRDAAPDAAPAASPNTADAPDDAGALRLVLCYGLFGFGYILPATYLPAQARLLIDDPAMFGWVWPVFGLAALISTLCAALLARWPRRRAWAAAQLVMAAGVLAPALAPGLGSLLFAALCVGGTFMLVTLLGLQEARTATADARRLMAAMTAAFATGQLAGPLAANALLGLDWPLDAALWLAAGSLLASSALLVRSRSAHPPPAIHTEQA
ncbi:YbfB/YjiJ family MFS transporter [Pseudothauera rhizosphaerae]|uniref:YbfB/YjiJ family MFS transporter n=1 Tax=Pseudothauera rhizosphaerae TaxID=2565932 RepID=A0A4S4A8C1_9RHOO|nr:YbfB/YjiJ family MFS transporter [Pseudothauera rhizosphaerae]THF54986.1 YbfB/YjiJ family MFS transporter [Pseudothauera rhizosphaerae]